MSTACACHRPTCCSNAARGPRTYNLAQIRRGLATFSTVAPADMFEAKRLMDLRLRQTGATRFVDGKLGAMREKYADILDLCDEMPDVNTPEFDALNLIVNVRARRAKSQAATA